MDMKNLKNKIKSNENKHMYSKQQVYITVTKEYPNRYKPDNACSIETRTRQNIISLHGGGAWRSVFHIKNQLIILYAS